MTVNNGSADLSLSCVPIGTLPVPGWEAFFGVNDSALRDLAFYVWLISDGERHGLIDLGLPRDEQELHALNVGCQKIDPGSYFHNIKDLATALDELGVTPDDIDYVLLTQLETYHSGGLEPDLLPRAHVYLAANGLLEMLIDPPGHPPAALYFTPSSWSYVRVLAAEGRLHVVSEAVEVVPGVIFEPTGGHHPGSAGVRLTTGSRTLGLLETAFFQRNIDELLPIGIAEDAALCRRVIKDYRRSCDEVLAIHDPAHEKRFAPSATPQV